MTKKLYQIILPLYDNGGRSTLTQREFWCQSAINSAGGCTEVATGQGHWQDEDRTQTEEIVVYQVGCEPHIWNYLRARAFALFPDQKAICWAQLGEFHEFHVDQAEGEK